MECLPDRSENRFIENSLCYSFYRTRSRRSLYTSHTILLTVWYIWRSRSREEHVIFMRFFPCSWLEKLKNGIFIKQHKWWLTRTYWRKSSWICFFLTTSSCKLKQKLLCSLKMQQKLYVKYGRDTNSCWWDVQTTVLMISNRYTSSEMD